jgi:hypothetical protein
MLSLKTMLVDLIDMLTGMICKQTQLGHQQTQTFVPITQGLESLEIIMLIHAEDMV